MKKLNFIIATFLLLVSSTSCVNKKKHFGRTDIIYMIDNTSKNSLIADIQSLINLYEFNDNPCKAAYFKLTYMNDFNYNRMLEYELRNRIEGEQDNFYNDAQFRRKELIRFMHKIRDAIPEYIAQSGDEHPHSNCYDAIRMELEELTKRKSIHKTLIVSSDLAENSSILNAYSETFMEAIQEDERKAIDRIKELFNEHESLPKDLGGITVQILFEPKTIEEDKRFHAFSLAYRELLEERNCKIYIKSTNILKNYDHE